MNAEGWMAKLQRWISTFQRTAIMYGLGASAFAVGFSHVIELAERSGQHGWRAYAIGVTTELLAFAAVLEMKHRIRIGRPAGFGSVPVFVFGLGLSMSLAANISMRGPGSWGVAMAAWPVIAFVAMAVMNETRPEPAPARTGSAAKSVRTPQSQSVRKARTAAAAAPYEVRTASAGTPGQEGRTGVRPEAVAALESGRTGGSPAGDSRADHQMDDLRADREEFIADLAQEIRTNPDWTPDYKELMRSTGRGRSWCEKAVRAARLEVAA